MRNHAALRMLLARRRLVRLAALGGAFLVATGDVPPALAQTAEDPSGPRPRLVVLVDWDGFDPAFLARAPAPNLRGLIGRGSLSIARSTFPTVSNSARASMSTGAYPEVHNNAPYYLDTITDRVVGQERQMEAETLAEALAGGGRTVASVQWYMVQNRGTAFGDPEHLYVQPGGPFGDRVNAAIDILERRPVLSGDEMVTVPRIPDFLAVYGDDFDALVHAEGAESPSIGPLLVEMDRQLGRLVEAVEDVGLAEETAFLLTSDHGMTSWNRTLIPSVTAAISAAGYRPEVVTPGNSPAPGSEVIIVPSAARYGDVTLRGAAATREGRASVRAALEALSPTLLSDVLDQSDLDALGTSQKLGDFIAEAQPPYAFALSPPPPGEWRGAHGSRAELPVPLVVSGAGFRQGKAPKRPELVDVAPTIAALLGVQAPAQSQGRVWTEALTAAVPARLST